MTTTPTTTNTFTEKDPLEVLRLGVDFKAAMQSNERIVSAVWASSTYSGSDPAPGAVIQGSPTYDGSIVYTFVQGGLAGRIYKLKAIAQTTAGRTLVGVGFLPVG